jgi:pSer/pThr/pTyr-binding forkhead associated (FHA) protein
VSAQIEVIFGVRSWRIPLAADRVTIGKAAENDVPLSDDPTGSRLHAVLERFPAGWCVSDLGSSNGTSVNGERVWSSHRLQHGDEIRVGQTRLVFHDPLAAGATVT